MWNPLATARNWLTKRQTDTDKFAAAAQGRVLHVGQYGEKPRPFNYHAAVANHQTWVYAATDLNARALASVPLRLFIRRRTVSALKAAGYSFGGTAFSTRPVSRRWRKAYLAGDLDHRPSNSVLQKIAEFGDEYEEVVELHPLMDLLRRVNPYFNGFDFASYRFTQLQLTGNAYVHPVLNEVTGMPEQLWPMPSQWVWVIPDPETWIRGYAFGESSTSLDQFTPDEVIHWKRPNPRDLYYGLGWVEAGWPSIVLHTSKREQNIAMFDNNARPDYAVIVKGASAGNSLDRLEQRMKNELRGVRKSGNFMAFPADVDIKPLSWPPKDLGDQSEVVEEIAAASGVPVSILKANDPNLASAEVGFSFWRKFTLVPYLKMDEEKLNESYLPLWGDDIAENAVLAYDSPVPEDEQFRLQEDTQLAGAGVLLINEVRKERGLEPVPGGDVPRINGQSLESLDAVPQAPASPFGFLSAGPVDMSTPGHATENGDSALPSAKDAEAVDVSTKAVPAKYDHIDFMPPKGVARAARQGLEYRDEYGRGGTATGIARARDLSNRREVSPETIRRMVSFFARHEANRDSTTREPDGGPTNGWIAWLLWGGDAGRAWSERILSQMDAADGEKSVVQSPPDDGTDRDHHEGGREPRGGNRRDDGNRGREGKDAGGSPKPREDGPVGRAGDDGEGVGVGSEERRGGVRVEHRSGVSHKSQIHAAWDGEQNECCPHEKDFPWEDLPDKFIQRFISRLTDIFGEQGRAIATDLLRGNQPADVIARVINQDKWITQLREAARPFVESAASIGGASAIGQLNQPGLAFDVQNPKVQEFVDSYTARLADEVNGYTEVRLQELIGDGMAQGEGVAQLSDRVRQWSDEVAPSRAENIARTESARAYESGSREAWKVSDVVAGHKWLLAPSACPICNAIAKKFNDRTVGLDEPFFQKGDSIRGTDGRVFTFDYETVMGPPAHPRCRCTTEPVLKEI